MFLLALLSAALLIDGTGAIIRWPFQKGNESDGFGLFLDVQIGTPAQKVRVKLTQDTVNTSFSIPSAFNKNGGTFKPGASSTFKETSRINKNGTLGVSGTDTFAIGGVTVKQLPFFVYDKGGNYEGHGSFSLAYSKDTDFNFIRALLKTQKEQIAVVTYDQVDYYNKPGTISGNLTFGGYPSECSQQWTRVKELQFRDSDISWAFKGDMLTVGTYKKRNPGTIGINFDNEILTVPYSTHENIVRAVGGDDGIDIPCYADTPISLTASDVDLLIGPETYVEPLDGFDDCIFSANEYMEDMNYYRLPVGVLKQMCILYDYNTNEVGFARRLD